MDEIYEEEVEEEQVEEYHEKKRKINLNDVGRKILTYAIIIIVAFSIGCGVVGFSMRASEKSPRKDLANTEFYIRTIIIGFEAEVYNETSEEFLNYVYEYNSNASTFEDSGGEVAYVDNREDMEYMTIYYPPAFPEMTIQEITFKIGEKSQLNIIIFADGKEVYNALKIKNDIELSFVIFVTEIIVYIF